MDIVSIDSLVLAGDPAALAALAANAPPAQVWITTLPVPFEQLVEELDVPERVAVISRMENVSRNVVARALQTHAAFEAFLASRQNASVDAEVFRWATRSEGGG